MNMTHRRSLALLAALLLPAAASALEGDVTLYGTLMPFFDNARVSDPTRPGLSPATGGATQVSDAAYTGVAIPQRFRLTSGTSNIGFKGGFDVLGEDLQVFFQVESAVSPDGDAPNAWASRNSAVGVKGKFGRAFFGNWDTPYKYPVLLVGAVRGLNPFDNTITANPGFGVPGTTTQSGRVNGKADAAFNRRQGNSVQYWTPELYGFSARLAYSANESRTVASATAPSISPTISSGLVSWAYGPLLLRYAYERHQDYFGLSQLGGSPVSLTNRSSTDQGHEAIAQLALPTGTRVSLVGERLSYENEDRAVGAVREYARLAYYALLQQRFGAHQVFGSFGQSDAGECKVVGGGACTVNGLGATQWNAGYSYALTKAADVYVAYYETRNDRSASYGVVGGPGAVAPGGDTRGFGLGLLYTFAATANVGAPKGSP
ncbi:porin [Anaeromyxobacter dehalogenans 2CP-1]|uniref:Porin n=2 Tax=Anaeromyxobacter dehalogenans TaxID=161493 RepID=B8JA06_ANAD2|nr:porin [Anaeromyxobacter dehalogenans 2CP-1]